MPILRTCRKINGEASRVFFGDNLFKLWRGHSVLNVKNLLCKASFDWLTELIVPVPFSSGQLNLHEHVMYFPSHQCSHEPQDRVITGASFRVDFLANRILRNVLDFLVSARCLRKLHFVIPPSWTPDTKCRPSDRFAKTVERMDSSDRRYPQSYLHAPDIWTDLAVLLQHRPDLEVTVIRLSWPKSQCQPSEAYKRRMEAQERLLRWYAYRLGPWDHREASMYIEDKVYNWTFPEHRTATDPNDLAEAFQRLFG